MGNLFLLLLKMAWKWKFVTGVVFFIAVIKKVLDFASSNLLDKDYAVDFVDRMGEDSVVLSQVVKELIR